MDRERPLLHWIAFGVIALAVTDVRAQDADRASRPATFADLAVYQQPDPSTPSTAAPTPPQVPTAPPSVPAPTPPQPPLRAEAAPAAARDSSASLPSFANRARRSRASRTVEFAGDTLGVSALRTPPVPGEPPPVPGPNPPPGSHGEGPAERGLILVPSVRSFKIAEGQSPRPIDRVYYYFNYFEKVNHEINRRFGAPVGSIGVYRNTIGFEKTFDGGRGSFGLQLPTNSVTAQSNAPGIGGTRTAVGDLSAIMKYAFLMNDETGSLLSAGLAVSIPTGPSYFAGSRAASSLHFAVLTPYLGYLWNRDKFFLQGFTSLAAPTNSNDVTLLHNDIAAGYYLYEDENPDAFLTAVVPMFEVHVNTPLNHRGVNFFDVAGTPDIVNLTYSLNTFFYDKTKMTLGLVTPVTDPRPFNLEVIAQLTFRF